MQQLIASTCEALSWATLLASAAAYAHSDPAVRPDRCSQYPAHLRTVPHVFTLTSDPDVACFVQIQPSACGLTVKTYPDLLSGMLFCVVATRYERQLIDVQGGMELQQEAPEELPVITRLL